MADIEEYRKLLKPPTKLEKTPNDFQNERMYCFCHKLGHLKECCHWNPNNPNNKLKDKNKFQLMKFLPTQGKE